jgi:undecaprenyl-diphosphatase
MVLGLPFTSRDRARRAERHIVRHPLRDAKRRLGHLDTTVDDAFDAIRGWPPADRLLYGASAVGDHGLIWLAIGAVLLLLRGWHTRAGVRLVVGIPLESLIVNGGIKSLFRRSRPVPDAPRPLHLRIPRTSSFPSGHASSAFFSATLLADAYPNLSPVFFSLAAVIAASRIHVKIHHASDVLAGAVVGAALGKVVARIAPIAEIALIAEPAPADMGEKGLV